MSVKQVTIQILTTIVLVSSMNINGNRKQNIIKTDQIYFPEQMYNINKVSHDRIPVEDKVRCGRNEYLYPGDNLYDWTCDCKPGFIFYPADGSCREAYRRGPCRQGEILILPKSHKSPLCVVNNCRRDGYVEYNGKCQELDTFYPCKHYQYLIGIKTFLTVKPATFELTCMDVDRFYVCNGICCTSQKGIRECFRSRRSTSNIKKISFSN